MGEYGKNRFLIAYFSLPSELLLYLDWRNIQNYLPIIRSGEETQLTKHEDSIVLMASGPRIGRGQGKVRGTKCLWGETQEQAGACPQG